MKKEICFIMTVALCAMLLTACGNGSGQQKVFEGNVMDLERAAQIGTVTAGTEYDEDFLIDNILFFNDEGEYDAVEELHYHIYVPDSHDGSRPYALYITLPGYGAYYFQGVAVNLETKRFAAEAKKYREEMIIVAPQPNDWGETSKRQTIGLTEYMLAAYNIDPDMVYISGYSGGGETLSPCRIRKTDSLAVLDVRDGSYFSDRGVSNQHVGGGLFAADDAVMGWLFEER